MALNVYIGHDRREVEAVKICQYSIVSRAKIKPNIIVLKQKVLRKEQIYWRPEDSGAATEFTFTRFLVPYLNNYQGWAIFCDCDFLWTVDINEVLQYCDDKYAAMVVKHDYIPKTKIKMDGQIQHIYPRKNWSSMVLWNCGHESNKKLDLEFVNNATGAELHRFQWLKDEEIGSLPASYNWLVGYYESPWDGKPKAIHYTDGGPWFEEYKNCEYASMWNKEKKLYYGDDPQKIEKYLMKGIELFPNLKNAPTSVQIWDKRNYDDKSAKIVRGLKTFAGIQYCKDNNLDFYYIDTGYFGNAKQKWYHRVIKNNVQYLGDIVDRPSDRLEKTKVVPQKMTDGSKILLVPPSNKVMNFFGLDLDEWLKVTIKNIKKYTDREIKIRLKPTRLERVTTNKLEDALADDVHCLVTFNSIAAVEALIFGKPAITLGPNSASKLCSNSIAQIENPKKPSLDEVYHFLCHLAYHQFTENEMKDGTCWRILHGEK